MLITHARTNDSLRRSRARRVSLLGWLPVAAAVALTGCTVKKTEAPELAGPSSYALSLQMEASPDVLTMDGVSRSDITIRAFDENGKPKSGIGMRVEVWYNGQIVDTVGSLSDKHVTTNGSGVATLRYVAPNSAPSQNSDPGRFVTLTATPDGNDSRNGVPRQLDIRLVPQGTVLPQAYSPVAKFTVSPTNPGDNQDTIFDAGPTIAACVADPANPNDASKCIPQNDGTTITNYQWDFGNGQQGNGRTQTIRFATAGSYVVTLVVTNSRGLSGTTTQTIAVTGIQPPTADFAISPGQPAVGQQVFFDANASRAQGGRTITNYSWNFGDGHFGSGLTESHRYDIGGAFNVTLTVTDSAGRTGAASKAVTVDGGTGPTAAFTTSPATIRAGQVFFLDATTSTAPPGRTLVRYQWNFGDNQIIEGARIDHVFAAAGTYTVTLTVTDSGGRTDTETRSITANP